MSLWQSPENHFLSLFRIPFAEYYDYLRLSSQVFIKDCPDMLIYGNFVLLSFGNSSFILRAIFP